MALHDNTISIAATTQHDIFISCDTRDLKLGSAFYNLCRLRGIRAFLAHQTLPEIGSTDFLREIERALDRSANLVLIFSNASYLEGGWIRAEWTTFLNEKQSGRKSGRLLTLRTPDIEISALPFMLRSFQSEIIPASGEMDYAIMDRVLMFLGLKTAVRNS